MTKLTPEERFWDFVLGNEVQFEKEFLQHLSEDERSKFFKDNPDFEIAFKNQKKM